VPSSGPPRPHSGFSVIYEPPEMASEIRAGHDVRASPPGRCKAVNNPFRSTVVGGVCRHPGSSAGTPGHIAPGSHTKRTRSQRADSRSCPGGRIACAKSPALHGSTRVPEDPSPPGASWKRLIRQAADNVTDPPTVPGPPRDDHPEVVVHPVLPGDSNPRLRRPQRSGPVTAKRSPAVLIAGNEDHPFGPDSRVVEAMAGSQHQALAAGVNDGTRTTARPAARCEEESSDFARANQRRTVTRCAPLGHGSFRIARPRFEPSSHRVVSLGATHPLWGPEGLEIHVRRCDLVADARLNRRCRAGIHQRESDQCKEADDQESGVGSEVIHAWSVSSGRPILTRLTATDQGSLLVGV